MERKVIDIIKAKKPDAQLQISGSMYFNLAELDLAPSANLPNAEQKAAGNPQA